MTPSITYWPSVSATIGPGASDCRARSTAESTIRACGIAVPVAEVTRPWIVTVGATSSSTSSSASVAPSAKVRPRAPTSPSARALIR